MRRKSRRLLVVQLEDLPQDFYFSVEVATAQKRRGAV